MNDGSPMAPTAAPATGAQAGTTAAAVPSLGHRGGQFPLGLIPLPGQVYHAPQPMLKALIAASQPVTI